MNGFWWGFEDIGFTDRKHANPSQTLNNCQCLYTVDNTVIMNTQYRTADTRGR